MLVIAVLVATSSMKSSDRMPNCSGVDLIINWVLVKGVSLKVICTIDIERMNIVN